MANEISVEFVARVEKLEKSIEKLHEKTTKEFESLSSDISNILENGIGRSALSIAKKFAPVTAGILAVKAALDSSFEGERINALNTQFEVLAKQAGIAANILKDDLAGSAKGLIDDTALIEAANKAIVNLGANAASIPQTLELARKATAVFGGEVVSNFEAINQAVATGNTRQLRSIGLIIDAEEAYKKYAATLNVSVNSLSESGKQQAILNAVLEKGDNSFKNIDPSINQLKESYDRLKVSINELGDTAAVVTNQVFGGFFTQVLDAASGALNRFGDSIKTITSGGVENLGITDQARILNRELEDVNLQLKLIRDNGQELVNQGALNSLEQRASELRSELELVNEQKRKLNSVENVQDQAEVPSPFNVEKAQLDAIKVQEIINKAQQDRLASQLAVATQEQERDAIIEQQKIAAAQGFALQRQEFAANEAINNQLTKEQENIVLQNMEMQHQANLQKIQSDSSAKMIALGKQAAATLQQGLASGIATGIQSIVTSLAKGENVFQNFVKAVAKVMGNLAIQLGTMFIAAGLSIAALGQLSPGAAIAAGAALVAVGTILSSLAGGGEQDTPGSGAFANGGGPGGVAGSQGSFVGQQTEFNPAQVGTSVNVTVQGNILDRRESGLEIANIIQEHFNTNGNVIVGSV